MFILDCNTKVFIIILQWECVSYSCFKKNKNHERKERAISVLEMLLTTISSISAEMKDSFHLWIFHSKIAWAAITLYFFLWWKEPHITTAPNEYKNLTEIMLFFNYLLLRCQGRTRIEKEDGQTRQCCTPQHPSAPPPRTDWGHTPLWPPGAPSAAGPTPLPAPQHLVQGGREQTNNAI